jgi:hypothetical protein
MTFTVINRLFVINNKSVLYEGHINEGQLDYGLILNVYTISMLEKYFALINIR